MLKQGTQVDAEPREWLIVKGAFFYREKFCGYTESKFNAGRYTRAEAEAEASVEPWHMKAVHQDAAADVTDADRFFTKLRAEMATVVTERDRLRQVLATIPAIAEEIRQKWDEGMSAGKLLIALIDPNLKYRPDTTAIHEAIASASKEVAAYRGITRQAALPTVDNREAR